MDERDEFFAEMGKSEVYDLTVPFSVQTPQWLNYIPLSVTYTKRVGGQFFGMGRNGSICNASIHLATHMDGEKHFYPNGRTIGQVPLAEWVGPGVIADISDLVSDASVYTPKMIHDVVDIRKGDILIIKTGWNKYGWVSPEFGRVPLYGQAPRSLARFFALGDGNGDQVDRRGRGFGRPSDEHNHAHLASQDICGGERQAGA